MMRNSQLQLVAVGCLCLVGGTFALSAPKPNVLQKLLLKAGKGKRLREKVVETYFDGVDKQNLEQIVSCFGK